MAHYQQQGRQHVDEYGNPVPGGHGVHQGQAAGGYGSGAGTGSYDAGGYGGQQAGYGATGTGVHDAGGYGGSGHPGYGATGTGVHDARGTATHGVYGPTGVAGTHDATGVLGGAGQHHTGAAAGVPTGATGTGTHGGAGITEKARGVLRRSGSSSSSSSEDDGMGGRRKKGLKEKIKEKMPGGHKGNQGQAAAPAAGAYGGTGTGTGYAGPTGAGTTTTSSHEKKGVMEKIKEKIPGGGHKDDYGHQHTTTTGGYAPGRTGTTGTVPAHGTAATTGEGTHEKKGLMEKIKEKLPGQH